MDDVGNELDLTKGSPAMLNHYLIKSNERKLEQNLHDKLQQRCEVMSQGYEGSYNWTGTCTALRAKKVEIKVVS